MSLGNTAAKYAFAIFLYAIIQKIFFWLLLPGRLIMRLFGFGSSAGWTIFMMLAILGGHAAVTGSLHTLRNMYIEAYEPDLVPVPLNFKNNIREKGGLTVVKSTEYLPASYGENGILHLTVTNDTKYPVTDIAFVCTAHGTMGTYEIFNTGYLFDGVMPPGQTRRTDVKFSGPVGGDYMTECELNDIRVPYGWWEGIPKWAAENKPGEGPSRLYDVNKHGMVSEGVPDRPRVFLGQNMEKVTDPYDGLSGYAKPKPDFSFDATVGDDGLIINVTVTAVENMPRNVLIHCMIQTGDDTFVDRYPVAFLNGIQANKTESDSVLIEDITVAKKIACELGDLN